ncbi:hypothetical protein MBLNU13_g09524t2 [Cladosporium sp. NU13]
MHENIERYSSTPTVLGIMNDQTPVKPEEAVNQAENADQKPTGIAKSLDQTQVKKVEFTGTPMMGNWNWQLPTKRLAKPSRRPDGGRAFNPVGIVVHQEAFENAINVKKALIVIQDAEDTLQKAKAAAATAAVVDEFFAWSSALEPDVRAQLQKAAGRALLKTAITELPANSMSRNGTTDLVMPLAIVKGEKHIRHLVLEIKLNPRSAACQVQPNMACRGIGPLCLPIPKLEVFVVSLFLERHEGEQPAGSFDPEKLALRNRIGWQITDSEDLKTTMLKILTVLYAKEPDRCKFVRFIDRHQLRFAHAGPLSKVPEFVAPQTRDCSSEFDADEDFTVAEQLLEQAYRYHRDIVPLPAKKTVLDDTYPYIGKTGNIRTVIEDGHLVTRWEPED